MPSDLERLERMRRDYQREIDVHNAIPPVVMCACADWQTCSHPWPSLWRRPNIQKAASVALAAFVQRLRPLFRQLREEREQQRTGDETV